MRVDAAERIDGQIGVAGDQAKAQRAHGAGSGWAAAGEDGRQDRRIKAKRMGACEAGAGMSRSGFDEMRAAFAYAAQAGFRPVHAVGADRGGEGRISGDKKDQSAKAAGAGERCADREALARAEMAIDYAPAPGQAGNHSEQVLCPVWIGEEPCAG